ncbi:MAG: nucleotidyltransferase domain-containing protein [Chloroflexi bacterium]|nr:nucleotidyltransferase domain-containing protein [Chloroflexota bacterium]
MTKLQNEIKQKKKKLETILSEHHVVLAYLYGSQARGEAGSLSDVDIAVLFAEELTEKERFQHVLQLIGELGQTFRRDDVSVVDLAEASPLLRHRVYYEGRLLYCASETQRIHFEVTALRDYVDTQPLRRLKKKYVTKRFAEPERKK